MNVPRQGTSAVRVRSLLHNACHAVRVDRRARGFHAYEHCQQSSPFGASDSPFASMRERPTALFTQHICRIPSTCSSRWVTIDAWQRRIGRANRTAMSTCFTTIAQRRMRGRRCVDPACRMPMAGCRVRRAPVGQINKVWQNLRGDHAIPSAGIGIAPTGIPQSRYRNSAAGSAATRPPRRRRSGGRCRPAARHSRRGGSRPRVRPSRRSRPAPRRRGRARATRR